MDFANENFKTYRTRFDHPIGGDTMHNLNTVLAVVLGGGAGKRLYPLTQQRSKPAVPIAGKYRLIDVPISNCINSGINHIAILTQYNSVSLHRHITQTYTFDDFHRGWVQIWAAEQTPRSADWYQGTADAVRKQLFEIKSADADTVLILAGDHLYRMDYDFLPNDQRQMLEDMTMVINAFFGWDFNSCEALRQDGNWYPIDYDFGALTS